MKYLQLFIYLFFPGFRWGINLFIAYPLTLSLSFASITFINWHLTLFCQRYSAITCLSVCIVVIAKVCSDKFLLPLIDRQQSKLKENRKWKTLANTPLKPSILVQLQPHTHTHSGIKWQASQLWLLIALTIRFHPHKNNTE